MTTAVASPTSTPAPSPSPTPSAAPAPASAPKAASPVPKAASQPPAAPSNPNNAANKTPAQRTRRDPATDPMRAALQKAAAATPAEPTDDASPAPSPAPSATATSDADKARAALGTTPATPTEPKPTEQPKPTAPDPMRELEALRRSNSEQGRRFKEMESELTKLREFREEQAKLAEQAKLKPYQAQHPDYNQSMQRVALAAAFEAATEGMDQAQRVATAQRMGITNDDLKLKNEWKAHQQKVTQEFTADPTAYIAKEADRVAEQKFEALFTRKMQEHQIRSEVHRHLHDPIVKQFAQSNPDDFRQFLQQADGNTELVANQVHMLHNLRQAEAEKAELAKRIEELEARSGMVTEQQRLLKSRATLTREPAGAQPVSDPLGAARAWAKANNIPAVITNPKFFAKLQELKGQNGKPQNA